MQLPKDGGDGTVAWEFADPSLLIPLILSKSSKLQDKYDLALRDHPCSPQSPWNLIIGFDEFAPGDKLKAGNHKKTMDLYFNFVELGHAALSQAATWFVPIAVRTDTCKAVSGGWAYMLAVFLKRIMLGTSGFATAGIPVVINGSPVLLFANLKILISDGDGLRLAYSWRGAASLKPCLKHNNVLKKGSDLAPRCPSFVEISEDNDELFHRTSSEQFYRSVDKVATAHRMQAAGTMTNTLYQLIAKTEGFNYCKGGLSFELTLRQPGIDVFQAARLDWVHSALQDGGLTVECHLFITSCRIVDKNYSDVKRYFQLPWVFPKYMKHKGASLYRIFDDYRKNSETGVMDKLRASASEVLGMYSILRHWAESEIGERPELEAELASFKAACKVLDIILLAKKRVLPMKPAGVALRKAIKDWFRLHKAVYNDDYMKPKHHWMFDVADQFDIDELVFDQFIIERLHLAVKEHAERIDNTIRYERSVLSGVINSQIGALKRLGKDCCLTDKHVLPFPGYDHAHLADHMDMLGMHIAVGDFVMHQQSVVGQVCGCVEELGDMFVIVEPMELVHSSAYYRGTWRKKTALQLWRAAEVEQADRERQKESERAIREQWQQTTIAPFPLPRRSRMSPLPHGFNIIYVEANPISRQSHGWSKQMVAS